MDRRNFLTSSIVAAMSPIGATVSQASTATGVDLLDQNLGNGLWMAILEDAGDGDCSKVIVRARLSNSFKAMLRRADKESRYYFSGRVQKIVLDCLHKLAEECATCVVEFDHDCYRGTDDFSREYYNCHTLEKLGYPQDMQAILDR